MKPSLKRLTPAIAVATGVVAAAVIDKQVIQPQAAIPAAIKPAAPAIIGAGLVLFTKNPTLQSLGAGMIGYSALSFARTAGIAGVGRYSHSRGILGSPAADPGMYTGPGGVYGQAVNQLNPAGQL